MRSHAALYTREPAARRNAQAARADGRQPRLSLASGSNFLAPMNKSPNGAQWGSYTRGSCARSGVEGEMMIRVAEYVPPEHVQLEFERVMQVTFEPEQEDQ